MEGAASKTRNFTLQRTLGEGSNRGQIDIPRIVEGGISCLIFAMCVSNPMFRGRRLRCLLQMLDVFNLEMEKHSERIALINSYQDVLDEVRKGRIAAILSIERGEALERDLGVSKYCINLE